jgi:diguanylate cyclase (GGDEF)-like protein/PAS domain S-box-containing protein
MVATQRDDAQLLRKVVDVVPALLGYWDRDLRNQLATAGYVAWFGWTPEQLRGRHLSELLGEELFARVAPHVERVLAGEAQHYDDELVDASGAVRQAQVALVPDLADDGTVLGFSVLVADVTDRVHAERALAVHQQRVAELSDKLRVVSALSASLNAMHPDRLQDAVAEAVLALGFDGSVIVLTDAQGFVRPRYGKGIFSVLDGAAIARDSTVTSEVLRDQALHFIADYQRYEHALPEVRATGVRSLAAVPIWSGTEVLGVLQAGWSAPHPLAHDDREVLGLLAAVAGTGLRHARSFLDLRRNSQELAQQAVRDALTGLGNRRVAEQLLRSVGPGDALVVLDLDHFKRVNDTQGHAAGDEVLRAFGRMLLGQVRQRDEAVRLGGEEFLLYLPETTAAESEQLVQRLRETWAQRERVPTFSAGVAVVDEGESGAAAQRRADAALYAAKDAGRDRTCVA